MSWRRSRESSDFSSSKGAIIDTNLTQRSDIILESTGFRWRGIRRKRDVADRFVEPAVGPETAGRGHIGNSVRNGGWERPHQSIVEKSVSGVETQMRGGHFRWDRWSV